MRQRFGVRGFDGRIFGRGDDTVGNPHRAQMSQFELFELVLLLKLDRQSPVEQFQPAVSHSAVPSPPRALGFAARDGSRAEASARAPERWPHTGVCARAKLIEDFNGDFDEYMVLPPGS